MNNNSVKPQYDYSMHDRLIHAEVYISTVQLTEVVAIFNVSGSLGLGSIKQRRSGVFCMDQENAEVNVKQTRLTKDVMHVQQFWE